MGERIEEIAKNIIQNFPNLEHDANFKVSSKEDIKYNCIAWAYNLADKWMWPNTTENPHLDGVHYWPTSDILDCDISNFIKAFEEKGYELCEKWEFEKGFRKIALYVTPNTTECTHAARQLQNGFWTSKLGKIEDVLS